MNPVIPEGIWTMTSLDDAVSEDLPPVTLVVEPGSRLETLLTLYDSLKAEAEAAEEKFEQVKGAIKTEMIELVPEGTPTVYVPRSAAWGPMCLAWRTPWQFQVSKLKEIDPATYVQFAVKKGRWEFGADRRKQK